MSRSTRPWFRRMLDRWRPRSAMVEARLETAESQLRKLRRQVNRLEERLSSLETTSTTAEDADSSDQHIRSFQLRLPSLHKPDDRTLIVELSSQLYVPSLLEEHGLAGYESSSLACWLAIQSVEGDGAAFDVGANVGPYSWLAAALTARPVVAFEPVPALLDAVLSVARRNGLDIKGEAAALADFDGEANLYLSDQTDSSNSLVAGFRRSKESITVPVRSLDEYLSSTGLHAHSLKIDTETNEPEVLAGAHRTLSNDRPWMIVEVLAGRTEERLMRIIQQYDYSWFPIDDSLPLVESHEIIGDPAYEHTNWLFAPTPPSDEFWHLMGEWHTALSSCAPTTSGE